MEVVGAIGCLVICTAIRAGKLFVMASVPFDTTALVALTSRIIRQGSTFVCLGLFLPRQPLSPLPRNSPTNWEYLLAGIVSFAACTCLNVSRLAAIYCSAVAVTSLLVLLTPPLPIKHAMPSAELEVGRANPKKATAVKPPST
jgi:hypothetical protein